MSASSDAIKSLADMMKYLGSTASFFQTKSPNTTGSMLVLLSHPSYKDEEIVNAYGIDVTILTFEHNAVFQSTPPEKFDSVMIMGKRYVFDFVHPVMIQDVIVGWTCYSKGKGA